MQNLTQEQITKDIEFLVTSDAYIRVIRHWHQRREMVIAQIYEVAGDTNKLHSLSGELKAHNDILYGLGYDRVKDDLRFVSST